MKAVPTWTRFPGPYYDRYPIAKRNVQLNIAQSSSDVASCNRGTLRDCTVFTTRLPGAPRDGIRREGEAGKHRSQPSSVGRRTPPPLPGACGPDERRTRFGAVVDSSAHPSSECISKPATLCVLGACGQQLLCSTCLAPSVSASELQELWAHRPPRGKLLELTAGCVRLDQHTPSQIYTLVNDRVVHFEIGASVGLSSLPKHVCLRCPPSASHSAYIPSRSLPNAMRPHRSAGARARGTLSMPA